MKRAVCLLLALLLLAGCGGAAAGWQEQYDLGLRYLNEENFQEAILAFTEAIAIDPNRPELYVGRAGAYIASGETAENLAAALADYETARALGYTAADLWLGLADVYIRQGDYDKAREVLEEGLAATGGDPDIQAKLDELDSGAVTDGAGRLRWRSGFDENGDLAWYHVYSYDEDGWETGVTHYDGAGNELGHLDLTYDEDHRPVQTFAFSGSDGWLIRVENTYNEAGQVVREASYPLDDHLATISEYTYDDQGRRVRLDSFMLDGQPLGYTLYGWGADAGQLDWLENYSAAGTLDYRIDYIRDDQGRVVRTDTTGPDGELKTYTVTEYTDEGTVDTGYDAAGNQTYRIVR